MKIRKLLLALLFVGGVGHAETARIHFFPTPGDIYKEPKAMDVFFVQSTKVKRIEAERGKWLSFNENQQIINYGYYSDGEKIEYIYKYEEGILVGSIESYLPYEYYEFDIRYNSDNTLVELIDIETSELVSKEIIIDEENDTTLEVYKSFTGFDEPWKKFVFNDKGFIIKQIDLPNIANLDRVIEYFYENDLCNKVIITTIFSDSTKRVNVTDYYYSDGIITSSTSKNLVDNDNWAIDRESEFFNYIFDNEGSWLSYEYLINEYDGNGDIKNIYKGIRKRKIDYYD